MSVSRSCPSCGASVSDDALEGPCQDCLGKLPLGATPVSGSEFRVSRSDAETALTPSGPHPASGDPPAEPGSIRREPDHPNPPEDQIRLTPDATIQEFNARRLSGNPLPSEPRGRFGDYELLGEIARGGMGVVYKARQVSLNRIVAVKMIRADRLAREEDIRRFRTEAQAAAQLQHPNIVAIHEVGEVQGQHFYSMDYVAGQSLSQVARERPLSPKQAAGYVQRIAEAIHYAHQRGILHRDLKPSNVLIDEKDDPQVTDFGLAKLMASDSEMTMSGMVMGSPSFMPPEQASGRSREVTVRSDVYSIGAILYDVLCGRPPFRAETTMETLRQVVEMEPVLPRVLNPRAPRDLETIVLKCLQKEPAKRYASAQELSDELSRFLRGEPIHARPVNAAEKAWRWCRRKPVAAAALGLLVIVAVGSPVAALRINKSRKMAEARLYAANMNLVQQALLGGSLGNAKAILERHRHDTNLMGFEWRYLWTRSRGDYDGNLSGHQAGLIKVVFSPDGKFLASHDEARILKIWDLAARQQRFSISNITILAGFTPDGVGLVVGVRPNAIAVCDVATGRLDRLAGASGQPIALLADGRTLAVTSTNFLVRLLDARSGKETFRLPGEGGVFHYSGDMELALVSISRDGRYLVSCEDGLKKTDRLRLAVLDLASRTVVARYEKQFTNVARMDLLLRAGMLRMLPDGSAVVWGGPDGFLRVWRWQNPAEELRVIPAHKAPLTDFVLSPDRRWFATASSDQTIKLWDMATLSEFEALQGHDDRMNTLAISPDGRWLASGSRDRTIKLWNVMQRRAVTSMFAINLTGPSCIRFSPDGRTLAVTMDNETIMLVESGSLREIGTLPHAGFSVGFTGDGQKLITISDSNPDGPDGLSLAIWKLETRTAEREVQLPPLQIAWPGAVELSPDGSFVALSTREGMVHLYDLDSGNELTNRLAAHEDRMFSRLVFSRDGRVLVGAGHSSLVHFWDVKQGRLIRSISAHTVQTMGLELSPDGKMLATAGRGQIRLWDANTGELRGELSGHRQGIYGLSFSPDGKTLASASSDGTVKLWNLSILQEVCTIPVYERPVVDADRRGLEVHFAPDGNSLWAVTWGGELKVWRAATWVEIQSTEKLSRR